MKIGKADILAQAMSILDDYGLADLTMRRLADALGVKPGAIYWHYENKQTLLAAVSDEILSTADAHAEGDWSESLQGWGIGLRAALLQHRDAADVVSSTRAAGLGTIDPVGAPAGVLVAAGWVPTDADRVGRALVHFVLGHVVEEQSRVQLIELGVLEPSAAALDPDGFDVGLELFIAGLRLDCRSVRHIYSRSDIVMP